MDRMAENMLFSHRGHRDHREESFFLRVTSCFLPHCKCLRGSWPRWFPGGVQPVLWTGQDRCRSLFNDTHKWCLPGKTGQRHGPIGLPVSPDPDRKPISPPDPILTLLTGK
jgi:hypothetical protein